MESQIENSHVRMRKIFECSYPDEKTFPLGYRPRESNPGTLTTYFRSTTPDLVPRIFAQQVDCEVCPVFLQIERGRAGSLPPPCRLRSAFRRAHRRWRRSRTARSAKDSTVYRTGDKRALGMRYLVWRCTTPNSYCLSRFGANKGKKRSRILVGRTWQISCHIISVINDQRH